MLSSEALFTSDTTPTMVRHAPCTFSRWPRDCERRRTALARVSLITTTLGWPAVSLDVKTRPRRDRNAHRREVPGRDPATTFRLRFIARRSRRIPLDLLTCPCFRHRPAADRKSPDSADSWQGFKACGQLFEESRRPAVDVEGQHGVGTEAGLHVLHAQEASHHEAGGREQHHRKRNLRRHQPAAHALANRALSGATTFMERFPQIKSRTLEAPE